MPIRPSQDYSDLDFDALRARSRNLISAAFPDWTDDQVADFGNTLVDLFCFVGDTLTKYQNAQARESRWSTATRLSSIYSLIKLIGYTPQGQTAAVATEQFTLRVAASAPVTIPRGTLVSTLDAANPVDFQLLADLVIPTGTTVATAVVESSAFQTDVFDSTGLLNQQVTLSRSPFLDLSETIQAGNGLYSRVANFLDSAAGDLHYRIGVSATGQATLTFGNGIQGAIPTGTVTADYKYGGGLAGGVDQNALRKVQGAFADANGVPVTLTVTNPLASTVPQDRQSVASIQTLAPLSIRVPTNCVARTDYEDVARQVTSVARALFLTQGEDGDVPFNFGRLYLVPEGSIEASTDLINAVAAAILARPPPNTFSLDVLSADYLVVNISVRAHKRRGVSGAAMKAAIVNTLGLYFNPTHQALDDQGATDPDAGKPNDRVDFGFYTQDALGAPTNLLDWSGVFDAIRQSPGVAKLDAGPEGLLLNGTRDDIAILLREFPKLGAVQVIDADTDVEIP